MSEHQGHLFVVHGRIESVIHDAAIIPVGREFYFNHVWSGLVGVKPSLPTDWAGRQWGRVWNASDRVWAVSVGGQIADEYDVILTRVVAAIARVSERREHHEAKRGSDTLPLIALPVVGIGLGGYSRDRGKVLVSLIARLHEAANEHNVDIALVTPDPAVFAAAQYARRDLLPELPERWERAAAELGNQALRGELALLLGAGVSIPAGLPSWHKLIETLVSKLGMPEFGATKTPLTVTDQAELIQRFAKGRFQELVAASVRESTRSSLLHALLAGLDCKEVVTTNYDRLYEQAVAATGREITSVMPWSSAHGADRWVLKLHGDVEDPTTIVLTRGDMLRYDAANRPSASLLQSLLLTRRLLLVGVSMTDDNVIRLAHEVQSYRDAYQRGGSGNFGTLLDVDGDHVRSRLWEGQLDWLHLPEMGAASGARAVELFLDRVAFHAARNSSWLLDPRFDELLHDGRDQPVAMAARELYERIPKHEGSKWAPLLRRLEELGVNPKS